MSMAAIALAQLPNPYPPLPGQAVKWAGEDVNTEWQKTQINVRRGQKLIVSGVVGIHWVTMEGFGYVQFPISLLAHWEDGQDKPPCMHDFIYGNLSKRQWCRKCGDYKYATIAEQESKAA